jgi:hypothetical protein
LFNTFSSISALNYHGGAIVTRDTAAQQNHVLFRDHAHDFQVDTFNTLSASASGHAKAFKYAGGERAGTNRTRVTGTVVLTVSGFAYTSEAVTFHYALKTFTF